MLGGNWLLRLNVADEVRKPFADAFKMKLVFADAGARFLKALDGVTDPEEKRRRIGHTFIASCQWSALDITVVKHRPLCKLGT